MLSPPNKYRGIFFAVKTVRRNYDKIFLFLLPLTGNKKRTGTFAPALKV